MVGSIGVLIQLMNDSKALLSRFVGRGGATGAIAEIYAGNAKKSAKYLLELKHQLKTNRQSMEQTWGKTLIRDLDRFRENVMEG